MQKSRIAAVYFITHQNNLQSILTRGILCRTLAAEFKPISIADDEVLERRNRILPNGRNLLSYTNLYINPRNAMMYRKRKQPELLEHLAIIEVSSTILDIPNILVSDMNAACGPVLILPVEEGLSKLDASKIFAQSWVDPDRNLQRKKMALCMAEVLVPDRVQSEFITAVLVANEQGRLNVISFLKTNVPIRIHERFFFSE